MQERPRSGERYRHFKNKLYQIITIAKDSETGEELVIYQALYENFEVYARPLSLFTEEVDKEKYPDVSQQYRFERIREELHEEEASEETKDRGEEQADPMLLRFIDAETYEAKYKVLQSMENTITERLVNDFAVILDVVIPEGKLSERYEQLKQCVATMARYETTRLR